MSALQLFEDVSEIVGYKSGVALGRRELNKFFRADERFSSYAMLPDRRGLRLESVEFEEIIEALLYKLGRLEQPSNPPPGIALFHKYKNDPDLHKVELSISLLFNEWMEVEIPRAAKRKDKTLNHISFLKQSLSKHGRIGLRMATEMLDAAAAYQMRSPWGIPDETHWHNIIELKDLFRSEKLNAYYGTFFDQRYIDYLHRNDTDLNRIHWRKFEELTAEYFARDGYHVELGPGRGDDGVDVRAWRAEGGNKGPPQIVVQCKRQKANVEKVVIKALYADVLAENADLGMIVTTSRLSIGAEATRSARAYPVAVADRETLKAWLRQLRRPGAGIVM